MSQQQLETPPAEAGEALENDYYSERLANINEENAVVATQNICNTHGVLLVKEGARIDRAKSEQLIKHKLAQPLEYQVQVEQQLNNSRFSADAGALFEKYPDLGIFHKAVNFDPVWRIMVEQYRLPPILWQKLTVLQNQMPQEYEKSIFCAWLSVMIGREMGMDEGKVESLYLAGLAHDMGMLHIDPAILNKRGPLDAAEWRAIQCHVVVGKMMIENMPGHKPEVAQAILEHHERCDGTGYPAKKSDRHLKELGLIVGMADSLQAIRVKQFERAGRTMIDAVPYLRINAHTFSYPVYQATMRLLQKSGLQPSQINPCGEESSLRESVLQRATNLQQVMRRLEKFQVMIEESVQTGRGQDLLRALARVKTMALSSGLLGDDLLSWLRSVSDNPEESVLGELLEFDLMLNEFKWQLRNLLHALNEFLDQDVTEVHSNTIVAKNALENILGKMQ